MKVGRFGRRTMRYRDIGEFTYGAVRMYYNGVYTGTTLTMKFVARPPAEREKISYSAQVQTGDEELDNLRDHIARVIAVRMDEELAAGRPAVWTPNLTFHPDGIEYRAAGFIGRKEPVKIPYSEVTNFGLEQGVFHLWVAGKEKSVMQEQVSAPNFFPGYVLLSSRFRSAGSN